MYTSVEEGARATGCTAVVDLGSGKGYLSQVEVFVRTQEQKGKKWFSGSLGHEQSSCVGRGGGGGEHLGGSTAVCFKTCYLLLVNNYQNQQQRLKSGGLSWV